MAFAKKVNAEHIDSKLKAVRAYHGFVSVVIAKVNSVGLETVLKQYRPLVGPPTEYFWLKKAFDRILTFAENVQIKQVPTELKGVGQTVFTIVMSDGKKLTNGADDSAECIQAEALAECIRRIEGPTPGDDISVGYGERPLLDS